MAVLSSGAFRGGIAGACAGAGHRLRGVSTPTAYPLPFVMEAWDNRLTTTRHRQVHIHGGNELVLVRDPGATIIHAGTEIPARPGTLFLHREPEQHGVVGDGAPTRLMVINYEVDDRFEADFPTLGTASRRIWHLDDDQMAGYLDLFTRIQAEVDSRLPGRHQAASAWLRLLLVMVGRLSASVRRARDHGLMQPVDAEVHRLRRAIDLCRQGSATGSLRDMVDNYDALRHRFQRLYGESPSRMLLRLRMEFAQGCLRTSQASIAYIAKRVGYARQHEFARAFRREVGCTPTAFRRQHGGGGALTEP